MRLSLRRGSRPRGLRLFFATDVHGSERCFRKFLAAANFYDVQYLIMGGDITGKALVPIERRPGGYAASYKDHRYQDMSEGELEPLMRRIRDNGQYPIVGERGDLEALADETAREEAFRKVVVEEMRRWVQLAEEHLRGTGVRCFMAPGNDDYWEIDEVLAGSDVVEAVEGTRVALDDTHEMITTGYSNITPWHTPRELDEPEYGQRLETMLAGCSDVSNLVAVIHPPPYDTELDIAPAIDADFKVQTDGASPRMTSVGSTAVRAFIEEHQPLLGLHGHIHDSRAAQMLGRTLCLNPGSTYTEGSLCGAIVELGEGEVISHQFVMG